MPFGNGVHQLLGSPVLFETLLDFGVRGACALEIAFVHHHNVSEVEHYDFLQLQRCRNPDSSPAPSHRQFHSFEMALPPGRCRCLNDDILEIRLRQQRQAIVRRGGESTGLAARGHLLRMYTRSSCELIIVARGIAEQRAFADYAGVVRQNRDASRGISIENRRTSSSISVVFPAPPGPVKPMTLGLAICDLRFAILTFCIRRWLFGDRRFLLAVAK